MKQTKSIPSILPLTSLLLTRKQSRENTRSLFEELVTLVVNFSNIYAQITRGKCFAPELLGKRIDLGCFALFDDFRR